MCVFFRHKLITYLFLFLIIQKNYTDDGVWTVSTGENDISTVGQTVAYNGSRYLNFWSTQYANMVNGTG